MANDKEKTQRRVYVLPTELVGRVVKFQEEKGLPSEVEAVRRLLDEALKLRDTPDDLALRFFLKFKENRLLSDVAREVLAGHPLITKIHFLSESIHFSVKERGEFVLKDDFTGYGDDQGSGIRYDFRSLLKQAPEDISASTNEASPSKGSAAPKAQPDLDDDIPF